MNPKNFTRRRFLQTAGVAGAMTGFASSETFANEIHKIPETEKGLTFLFQGDSITDGNRGRNNDPNHIMGHGYAFSIASRIGADFPAAGFSFYNRGISGNRIPDLEERWQKDTLDLKPDVLSLLVGINDAAAVVEGKGGAQDLDAFEKGYRKLLLQCQNANSDILFVLGIPFVFPVGARKEHWEFWKNETLARAEVVRKAAKEFDAVLVDFDQVFQQAKDAAAIDYWVWDGIHPTVFGHELMAREWIRQVSERLGFLDKYQVR